jgi:uncharacterized protein involved in type VI secretion and phage assembly
MSGPRDDGDAARHFGVYPALVTDLEDPAGLGRIRVTFPWLGAAGSSVATWATLVSPYADANQGFEFVPARGTQVLVAFEAGDLRRPYVLGACWNGSESLPQTPSNADNIRLIRTRSGHEIRFDDTSGAARVTVATGGGHSLVLDDAAGGTITLTHQNGSTIEINVLGEVSVTANLEINLTAAMVTVHAPIATFDGIVECQTLISDEGVVSPSYTPGTGNVW